MCLISHFEPVADDKNCQIQKSAGGGLVVAGVEK
jgi:hypothetical protein